MWPHSSREIILTVLNTIVSDTVKYNIKDHIFHITNGTILLRMFDMDILLNNIESFVLSHPIFSAYFSQQLMLWILK